MRFQVSGFRFQVFCALLALGAGVCLAAKPAPSPDALATVVVFNNKDSESVALAGYYAERRGIPFTQLVGIDCELKEEITRDEFDRLVAAPLREAFDGHGWWRLEKNPEGISGAVENKIRFMALMRGVPLKIAPVDTYPGDRQPPENFPGELRGNAASVDSELARLGFASRTITAPMANPYFESELRFADAALPAVLLVCRLDAADAKTVRRMIDDSLAAERDGLWGFCYADMRGIKQAGLIEGDKWIQRAALDAQKAGFPVILDNGDPVFPAAYPMRHAALYYGWYSGDVAGPPARDDFRFARGAVAVHIHSFSAASLRDTKKGWCAPLLAHGAAATAGNVYEPLLPFTANIEILQSRLGRGFTFAEAAYASLRGLSWMSVFVGDPLYRPFAAVSDSGAPPPGAPADWLACRSGIRTWYAAGPEAGAKSLAADGLRLRSGVVFETLGLFQAASKKLDDAYASLAQARKFYPDREDALRTWIHQVNLQRFNGRAKQALVETRRLIKAYPNERATEIFRMIERQLAPPPSPAATTTAAPRR